MDYRYGRGQNYRVQWSLQKCSVRATKVLQIFKYYCKPSALARYRKIHQILLSAGNQSELPARSIASHLFLLFVSRLDRKLEEEASSKRVFYAYENGNTPLLWQIPCLFHLHCTNTFLQLLYISLFGSHASPSSLQSFYLLPAPNPFEASRTLTPKL